MIKTRAQMVFLAVYMLATATIFSAAVHATPLLPASGHKNFGGVLLAAAGVPNLRPYTHWRAAVSQGEARIEPPAFAITSISSSTSPVPGGLAPIEPAYGDNVTFHWSKRVDNPGVQSIVILKEDIAGTIVDPADSQIRYSIAAEAPLSGSARVLDHGADPAKAWRWSGEVTWPAEGKYLPVFPSGHLRIGLRYDDGHTELTSRYIDVRLSVFDVYTSDSSPFFPENGPLQLTTSVNYSLSAPAQPGHVEISFDGLRIVRGTAHSGKNFLPAAWDASSSDGSNVYIGVFPLEVHVRALAGEVGHFLEISNLKHAASFIPARNQKLAIRFVISEPVPRPQATRAYVDAEVYDASGDLIRVLATDKPMNINNRSTLTDGHDELTWDGKSNDGHSVTSGRYTIAIFAHDNAGEECESPCVLTSVNADDPPVPPVSLEWPASGSCSELNSDPGSDVIWGDTDSTSGEVAYTLDGGKPRVVRVDPESQGFPIDVNGLVGHHSFTFRTVDSRFGPRTITVPYFANDLAITGFHDGARFDPKANGDIRIPFTSLSKDTVDITVIDPYDQSDLHNPDAPVPYADVLNGSVCDGTVRTLATGRAINAGASSILWDGKDGRGRFVRPGVYEVLVESTSDGLITDPAQASINVVVEHPSGAPEISEPCAMVDGSSIAVDWTTNVPTTGCVVYENHDGLGGRVNTEGPPRTDHRLWLAATSPATVYNYYVIATDPNTGESAVSSRGTAITMGGERPDGFGTDWGKNSVRLSASTERRAAEALEYARVVPGLLPIKWKRIEDKRISGKHTFYLPKLIPNSEYVFRFITSADRTWDHATKSPYTWFSTHKVIAKVRFPGLHHGGQVTAVNDVTVRASCSLHRFSSYGITKVQLLIDGEPVKSFDRKPKGGYVDYTFHAASLRLRPGLHVLEADAYDDLWVGVSRAIVVQVKPGIRRTGPSGLAAEPSEPLQTARMRAWTQVLPGGDWVPSVGYFWLTD